MKATHPNVWRTAYTPWEDCSEARKDALREAWALGELSYKLSPAQRVVYDEIRRWSKSPQRQGRTFVMDIGRRFGKSSILVLIAFEDCLRNPGWRWPYYGPKHKDLMKFIREHLSKLLLDCPPDLMPEWTKSDSTYRFYNGSQVEFIGLDVNPDGARGGSFDGCGLDEAGFFDNLENIVQSVLVPQMMGKPHARIYAGSTPPISTSHYWSSTMVPKAVLEGACLTRTIDDSDIYTTPEKEEFIAELGGRKAARCRRELFTEHVTDESLAIIPEFRDVEKDVMVVVEPPYWRDCYTAMDPGWNDHTAVLFGFWHFAENFLYVEDEVSAPRMNSALIADLVKQKETVLWTGVLCHRGRSMNPRPQPYMRVSDNDPRLLFDLANDHKLIFTATAKDNLDQQINSVRVAISEKRIRIHPRCKMLRNQLKNGVWRNEARKVFAREGGDLGHFDLIAALVYLWRNASMYKGRNPAPREEKYVADMKIRGGPDGQEGQSKWSRRNGRLWLRAK
jgi:hypothetical protein